MRTNVYLWLFICFIWAACSNTKSSVTSDSTLVDTSKAVSPDSLKADSSAVESQGAEMSCDPQGQELFGKIQDTVLRKLLYCFEYKQAPFYAPIKGEDDLKPIQSENILIRYFENENDESLGDPEAGLRPNTYFTGYVFQKSATTIGVLVHRHFYPGAFGVDNMFLELFEFDFSGKQLQYKTVGCNCSDSNMGANELLTGLDSVLVYKDSAVLFSKSIRDQYMMDNEEGLPVVEYSETLDTSVVKFY